MARQLDESIDVFLRRLPPSMTSISSSPWIWIANPLSDHRPSTPDIATFKQRASDLMESYLSQKATLEHKYPHKVAGSITRMLKSDRDLLERDLLNVAETHQVTNGKWMLFPLAEEVDSVWSTVAKATLSGTLGSAAKVATNNTADARNHQRLICIYTDDFSDVTDIRRVLNAMKELKLVKETRGSGSGLGQAREEIVYYKCDAYTYLDLTSGNEFKIKASLYNSKDVFAEMRAEKEENVRYQC